MKANYYSGLTGIILSIFLLLVLATGCTKEYIKDPLIDQKNILTGSADFPTQWKLFQVVMNNVNQDTVLKSFTKQYLHAGRFKDGQGCNGNWQMTAKDSLLETYTNFISGVVVNQTYTIKSLTPFYLKLNYTSGGKNIQLVYEAVH